MMSVPRIIAHEQQDYRRTIEAVLWMAFGFDPRDLADHVLGDDELAELPRRGSTTAEERRVAMGRAQ